MKLMREIIRSPSINAAQDENGSLIYFPLNFPHMEHPSPPTTVQLHLRRLGRKQPYLPSLLLSINCCSFQVSGVCAISMPFAFSVRWTFSTQVSATHSWSVLLASMICPILNRGRLFFKSRSHKIMRPVFGAWCGTLINH